MKIGSKLGCALNVKYTSDFEKSVPQKECKVSHLKILYSLHVEIITF